MWKKSFKCETSLYSTRIFSMATLTLWQSMISAKYLIVIKCEFPTEYEGPRLERKTGRIRETIERDEKNLGGKTGRNWENTDSKLL